MKRNHSVKLLAFGAALSMLSVHAHAVTTVAVQAASLMPSFSAPDMAQALAAAGLAFAGSTAAPKPADAKWFRIATAGPTVDGREIAPEWITQMAASYDPKVYGARINLEHIKGIDPASLFRAYGDVLALKAEEVDGEMALFAQLAPTPDLVALVKAGQKIYTSCEVHPSFGDTKQAYLVALAVTDNPASLGVEALKFSARNTANWFSAALETSFDLEVKPEPGKTLLASVSALLGKFKKRTDDGLADVHQAVELLADHGRQLADANQARADAHAALQASHDSLAAEFSALQKQLKATPDTPHRVLHSGGGNAVKTDC